jgi:hypothetical protein
LTAFLKISVANITNECVDFRAVGKLAGTVFDGQDVSP